MDAGRIFGTLSRTSPDLWEWVERESLLTGKKKHEVLQDAIARAIIEREVILRGLTMEQLMAAWDLKDRLELMMLRKTLELGTSIFGQLFMQIGQLVGSIREYQDEQMAKIVEQEKKRDIDFQLKKAQAQMTATLLQTMMPTLTSILTALNRTQTGIKIPEIKLPTTDEKKKKAKVEIID